MSSWSGLITLQTGMKSSPLSSFINILPIATPMQQEAMLDALFRVLLIVPPVTSNAPASLMQILENSTSPTNTSNNSIDPTNTSNNSAR